ncbi:MAG: hypothetical protein A3I11_05455 [Elusimicrobia bacterium RIFCSPLOWO2_02_FULL_39_32]|nr:MAG: hypothetical protein A2034_02560 [Elusimicrobia bacterium GWA2_38_7]OGR80013.1 MAG: hypothetical protein A3B80_00150 [Elusimicrobia bacterium RIFCSPHIGHO2_02_FULL_39_36]OGR91192.1 MAG: hypothetical protein A3I11_05455 [Elusimicrobia bacterium RIFCSPLOWO2_02_FULL_39_32]OGS00160.1 MAG: hypothetical protein A3G85_08420 [Elusimicrobia bacterium RIFCSPLOWO2_12_FULL_39_28]
MFIDKAHIIVQAGSGGDGCLSFRREKYIPFGGPNGGNGGPGGDVFFVADQNITTLLDFINHPHFKAENGTAGSGWDKAGKSGQDLKILVPCGTVIFREGKMLGDLRKDKEVLLIANGGRGGRGNASFKTSRNNAPRIAEKGEPGETVPLDLELKLIADVGLIGCPNAGKSTLLSRISAARPKIADYPFTTLSPNLGVAQFKEKSFVVADIPGLIEGAHLGKGLGLEFLRHVERTRMLVHLVDVSGYDGKTPLENVRAIQKEMCHYSQKLAKKSVVVVMTKMDLTGAEEEVKKLKKALKSKEVLSVSAVSGHGIQEFLALVVKKLKTIKEPVDEEIPKESAVGRFIFEDEFAIEKEENGFRVKGKKVERLFAMTNFKQDEAVSRFQNILKKMGVEKALEKKGCQAGDLVYIRDMEFNYSPKTFSN